MPASVISNESADANFAGTFTFYGKVATADTASSAAQPTNAEGLFAEFGFRAEDFPSIDTRDAPQQTESLEPKALAEFSVVVTGDSASIIERSRGTDWDTLLRSKPTQTASAASDTLAEWGGTCLSIHVRRNSFVEIVSKNVKDAYFSKQWQSRGTPEELKGDSPEAKHLRKHIVAAFLQAMGKTGKDLEPKQEGNEWRWAKKFAIAIYTNKAYIPSVHESPTKIDWMTDLQAQAYLVLLRPLYQDVIHTEPPVPIRFATVEAGNNDLMMGM